jgi:hypothetical protein
VSTLNEAKRMLERSDLTPHLKSILQTRVADLQRRQDRAAQKALRSAAKQPERRP